jgi:hypothetical protein
MNHALGGSEVGSEIGVRGFSSSATELTTAGSDLLLGVVCVLLAAWLLSARTDATWKRSLWALVFGLLGVGSFFGAAAHGLDLTDGVRDALWHPLYLSLGVAVAFFVVAALCDWRGEPVARTVLPWAALTGCGFFAVTQIFGGSFLIFVAYEAVALLAAFAVYGVLAAGGQQPGAVFCAAGMALSLAAAGVQASRAELRLVVPFDHNGLFHVLQLIAIIVLGVGVRRSLDTARVAAS